MDSGGRRPRSCAARLRRIDVPLRRPGRALHDGRATSRASAWRPATRAGRRLPRRARASTSTGPPGRRRRVRGAARGRGCRGRRRLDRHDPARQQGLEIFGPVILESDGGADQPRRRGARRHSETCTAGSSGVLVARQYVLMDYDLPRGPRRSRPPRSRRAWSRPRSRRCATRTGSPCASWSRETDTNQVMDELYDTRRPRHPGQRHPRRARI